MEAGRTLLAWNAQWDLNASSAMHAASCLQLDLASERSEHVIACRAKCLAHIEPRPRISSHSIDDQVTPRHHNISKMDKSAHRTCIAIVHFLNLAPLIVVAPRV
jgi:hypothetical protein